MEDKKWKVKSVRMDDDLWFSLAEKAAKQRKTPSELIRDAIENYLNEEEE